MCKTNVFLITALVIIFSVIPQKRVRACTRVVYQGNKDNRPYHGLEGRYP